MLSTSCFYNNVNTISFIFRVKMSSSQAKDLDQDGELIAYVPNWSHVHKSGKLSYTTCQLQTPSTATVKAICFSPDKAKPLKSAMETKSPIKLRKHQFNQHSNNIVNKDTNSQLYRVTWLQAFWKSGNPANNNAMNSISPQQLLTVKAKVTQLTGPKTQRRMGQQCWRKHNLHL